MNGAIARIHNAIDSATRSPKRNAETRSVRCVSIPGRARGPITINAAAEYGEECVAGAAGGLPNTFDRTIWLRRPRDRIPTQPKAITSASARTRVMCSRSMTTEDAKIDGGSSAERIEVFGAVTNDAVSRLFIAISLASACECIRGRPRVVHEEKLATVMNTHHNLYSLIERQPRPATVQRDKYASELETAAGRRRNGGALDAK